MRPLIAAVVAMAAVLGAEARRTVPISDAPASFVGEQRGDEAGSALAGAADVNGDGLDDLIVGAWANDSGGQDAGKVYLILGRTEAAGVDVSLSESQASFVGENPGDFAGLTLAGVGDVNADGLDDFIIGAQGNDDGADDAGKVYLMLGRAAADWGQDFNLAEADASFVGLTRSGFTSACVAGAGDFNGDGFDDFLVTTPGRHTRGRGEAHLILGRETGWSTGLSLSSAEASFVGLTRGDYAGFSAAGVGDVNGDDLDDVVIGAWGRDANGADSGEAFLILGRREDLSLGLSLSEAVASFRGEAAHDRASQVVSAAGDWNGDGLDDFAIAAPRNREAGGVDPSWGGAGQVYLIPGRRTGWRRGVSLATAPVSFHGETEEDQAGSTLATAGDVDGDGRSDLLIGALGSRQDGTTAGVTYLVPGASELWDLNMPLSVFPVAFLGEESGDQAGCGLAGIGDFNGDGSDDFAIGARYDDTAASRAGKVSLLLSPISLGSGGDSANPLWEAYLHAQEGDWGAASEAARRAVAEGGGGGLATQIISLAASRVEPEDDSLDVWIGLLQQAPDEDLADLLIQTRDRFASEGVTLVSLLEHLDVDRWVLRDAANSMYTAGHPEEAVLTWERALVVGPPHAELHLGASRGLRRLGRNEEALEAAHAALALTPEHGYAELFIGEALLALDRSAEARAHFEACLECEVDSGSHETARVRLRQMGAL